MKSKIIKVSIILIFMMFSAGLFNFCFALTPDIDFEITESITMPNSKKMHWVNSKVLYDLPNENNIQALNDNIVFDINELLNCYNTNGYIYSFYRYSSSGEYRLQLRIPHKSNTVVNYIYQDTSSCFRITEYGDETFSQVAAYTLYYDFTTNNWIVHNSNDTTYALGLDKYNYYVDSKLSIYDSTWKDGNIIYEPPVPPLTEEELVTNCDFNVRIEFGESEELSTNYPIKNHIGMQKVTIIHSLTNWNYYDVKLNITLEDYGFWINQRFHYAHYSTNMTNTEIKDVETICIEEPVSLNLALNDYLAIYSAKAGKYVRLEYNIYSKFTNELLLVRTIRFRFDGDGFFILQDSTDKSGTILEDSLYDSDGNIVENNSNNIVSNGKDLTDTNVDFDFSSGFKLDVDTLKGSLESSIESSKSFFNLFSTFLGLLPIWISTLLYFFLFGVIIITLYRFIRGA